MWGVFLCFLPSIAFSVIWKYFENLCREWNCLTAVLPDFCSHNYLVFPCLLHQKQKYLIKTNVRKAYFFFSFLSFFKKQIPCCRVVFMLLMFSFTVRKLPLSWQRISNLSENLCQNNVSMKSPCRMRNSGSLIIRNGVWQIKVMYFTGGPHNLRKGIFLWSSS